MKKKEILIALLISGFVYLLFKMKKKTNSIGSENSKDPSEIMDGDGGFQQAMDVANSNYSGQEDVCTNPYFSNLNISGRFCSGSVINENKVLKLGDNSCEVLLLQQRLNSMETERNILKPNGQFCCECKAKLLRLMRVPQIALNQFSPDEQTGFNELVGGTKITPYSYMDLTK